jgi:hypothetical protein
VQISSSAKPRGKRTPKIGSPHKETGEQGSARFGARESYLFGRHGWPLVVKFGVRTFPARMFGRRDPRCRPLA